MCGITGILSFANRVDPQELERFTLALRHRGPDGHGTYCDDYIGLGHTRLAILDLSSAGKCPMHYTAPDGTRLVITFNGEIYNFLELRTELEGKGYTFHSQTDTEVIAAAFHAWGEDCLFRFNGMWAFALWNVQARSLFLARDRFGVKPLYISVTNRLAFASELKAFLELDGFSPQLNEEVVPIVLGSTYAYEGITDMTPLRNVYRLPAGHCLRTESTGAISVRRWWETANHLPAIPTRYEEQMEMFRDLFLDAVRLRMRSDVPVGTSLSGGVDSSAVASAMAWLAKNSRLGTRAASSWQHSVIAEFPGSAIDERRWADMVVDHIGATPLYWSFDPISCAQDIAKVVWSMEDIYGGINVGPWNVYRALREHGVFVSLDGHGGDELLGGYTWYLDVPEKEITSNLYSDFHTTLLPSILRNYDRCSMAHGIEVRMPMMDWRLVTFAFALPREAKLGGGYTKRVLRDSMTGIMPESIRTRRQKIGFNAPMIEWFNNGMGGLLETVLNSREWLASPFFDGRSIRAQVLEKTHAHAWTHTDWGWSLNVWTYMNLVLWQMMFTDRHQRRNLTAMNSI